MDIKDHRPAAGGWGALKAVAESLKRQQIVVQGTSTLLKVNQPDGFDCPGCAWPDPSHSSSFEFCENGAKAVTWESTARRLEPSFFEKHTVSELWNWSDHALEDAGRITQPLIYDAATDRYAATTWEAAFEIAGEALRALPDPNMAEFYTSGRASNEAAFLYQVFVRAYGTNNFPDCSNMCHEATSVGLPYSIGVGKGTVLLEDFDSCDVIFSFGHNPGTNHPRMMATLRDCAKRGVKIVVFNPLRERALERFTSPQSPVEMATMSSTPIASTYCQVQTGGDLAAIKGIMKRVLERDAAAPGEGVLDREFIESHTIGIEALVEDLNGTDWCDIEEASGLSRAELESAGDIYVEARNVIVCYGMGITQHVSGTGTVQQLANLLMLRGNIGRKGAGICPLRGHSNVQGDRTVGITEIPTPALLDGIERAFNFRPPAEKGHNAVECVEAIAEGRSRALVSLGGNLAVAMPDHAATFEAMRKLDLAVHITTKLNRSQLLMANTSIILPVLGRTDIDIQATGPQIVSVEDSMSMVHSSRGFLRPPSPMLRSEPAVVAGLAKATLRGRYGIDWDGMVQDYSRIRDKIEWVFPDFRDYNVRLRRRGGFRLTVAATDRVWNTPDKKAVFLVAKGLNREARPSDQEVLILTTIRSHDQYNTTIYGLDDRYRGVFGRRDVIFLNRSDIERRGISDGELVEVAAYGGKNRAVMFATVVAYDIPKGCAAGYYPEMNGLISLSSYDPRSGTPSYKSVPVTIRSIKSS